MENRVNSNLKHIFITNVSLADSQVQFLKRDNPNWNLERISTRSMKAIVCIRSCWKRIPSSRITRLRSCKKRCAKLRNFRMCRCSKSCSSGSVMISELAMNMQSFRLENLFHSFPNSWTFQGRQFSKLSRSTKKPKEWCSDRKVQDLCWLIVSARLAIKNKVWEIS